MFKEVIFFASSLQFQFISMARNVRHEALKDNSFPEDEEKHGCRR